MLGDKGYDSDAIRDEDRARGGTPEISTKKNRHTQHTVNRAMYTTRHRIECFFNRLKNSIGEDVSEMLDIVSAIIRIKRIRRPRFGCRVCECAVVQAPAPPRPIEGGLPTAALLAHVTAAKFAWHLTLYRQTQMLAGHGIKLDRSTLYESSEAVTLAGIPELGWV